MNNAKNFLLIIVAALILPFLGNTISGFSNELNFSSQEKLYRTHFHTDNSQQLLYQAIINDSAEEILDAIINGAEIDLEEIDGRTPLLIAVLTQKPIAILTLLDLGADGTILYEGRSLLYHVKDVKSAIALVDAGADFLWVDDMNNNALEKAFWLIDMPVFPESPEDGLRLIEKLIDKGYPINNNRSNHRNYEKNALFSLFTNHHVHQKKELRKALDLLIKKGANVNQLICTDRSRKGTITPLMLALYKGGEEAVKMLIDAGANVNQKANPRPNEHKISISPIQYAQRYVITGWGWEKKGSAVELLLKYGASL